ncbi:MAG: hypothetical protein M3454_01050, partial [Actinomycetota bacterium]|nr:hypothetical protein [Actinomycetota bacterium]
MPGSRTPQLAEDLWPPAQRFRWSACARFWQQRWEPEPLHDLKATGHFFVEFCTEDPVRYQLLFQRTIPGFEPSAESFALS